MSHESCVDRMLAASLSQFTHQLTGRNSLARFTWHHLAIKRCVCPRQKPGVSPTVLFQGSKGVFLKGQLLNELSVICMFTAIGQSDNDGHFLELCLTTQILWICEALVFPHIHGVLSPHSLESLHSSCFFRTRLDHIGINSMIAGCYTPVMIHCRCYRMLAFVWTCSSAEGRREEGCFEIEWQDVARFH